MKNTILSALTILAYFFAVSCEDAVNSDENLYINGDECLALIQNFLGSKIFFLFHKKNILQFYRNTLYL